MRWALRRHSFHNECLLDAVVGRVGDARRSKFGEAVERVGSDIHEEASVKTGARRARDFPDIHSASSAVAERHE